MASIEDIKKLREETGAGVLEIKQVLEEVNNDVEKAKKELEKRGAKKAAKKAERTANDGLIHAYIHSNGRVGSMVHVACETDFVARTEDFQNLVHNIALQVCTMKYKDIEELLQEDFIKDSSQKISDLITKTTAKVGEKIEVKRIVRFSVDDSDE